MTKAKPKAEPEAEENGPVAFEQQETGDGEGVYDVGDEAPDPPEFNPDAHPFGGDSHPMHDWDQETRQGVMAWCHYELAKVEPRLVQAAAALSDLNERSLGGEPIPANTMAAADLEYQAALLEHGHVTGKIRTLTHRHLGSYDQVMVGGQNGYIRPVRHDEPGGWQHNETKREEQIVHLNRLAVQMREAPPEIDPADDPYVDRDGSGIGGSE